MNNRLPVNIENMELPVDPYREQDNSINFSSGFISIMSLISLIITVESILAILILGSR